jgi:hypothetical protein
LPFPLVSSIRADVLSIDARGSLVADHDNSYKLLFSHAEMVADLLRGFIREDWVRRLG